MGALAKVKAAGAEWGAVKVEAGLASDEVAEWVAALVSSAISVLG